MKYKLKNKKVLVVGLGRSGIAAAKFAANCGARVCVSEKRSRDEVKEAIKALEGFSVEYSCGQNDPVMMVGADLIIASPGVPLNLKGLEEARKKNIPIIGELELALSQIEVPLIAVTGTNGKTTTTSLIGHILSMCGVKTCVGGNIGTALLGLIEEAKGAKWVVAEVSSFQLETTPSLAPHIGVLLNITPDHLDRHANFEEYADIKAGLLTSLGISDFGVYNSADQVINERVKNVSARLIPFNVLETTEVGGYWDDGHIIVKLPCLKYERFSVSNVSLKGAHNRENILAAVIVAVLCGGNKEKIQEAIQTFKGLPHRLQLVGEYKNVLYYNDSKGTNIGATAAALGNFEHNVILIAGGQDKGLSYEQLAPFIPGRVKKLILIGESKEKMQKELNGLTDTVLENSLEEAVKTASDLATDGDVVLFSPACASFDMFRDYNHRGEVFVNAVKETAGK